MPRATIVLHTDDSEERQAFEAWRQAWQSSLAYISDNKGCGCCVRVFEVEGSLDAIDAIPHQVLGATDWLDADLVQAFHFGH